MTTPLLTPPGDGYRRARLIVKLGPLLPAGKEGWIKAENEKHSGEGIKKAFLFISATNHDLMFRVYADEIELL